MRLGVAGAAVALVAAGWAAVADAQMCEKCDSSMDCSEGVCVEWFGESMCDEVTISDATPQRTYCCPSPGCELTDGGVPSCEAEGRCARVDPPPKSPAADAAAVDARQRTDDASPGNPGEDAGGDDDPPDSCSIAGGDGALWMVLLVAVAWWRRQRSCGPQV